MGAVINRHPAAVHLARFLDAMGLSSDPEAAETPERVAAFLSTFRPPDERLEVSATATSRTTPVVVRDVPFYSLCVHHLLPFFGTVAVGYRPAAEGRLLGLGAIPRVVRHHSRQLQLQERLADDIADTMMERSGARAVAVCIRARHMCVEMRGAERACEVVVVAERGEVDGAPDRWLLEQVQRP